MILITASCVGCDQAAKSVARSQLAHTETVSLAGDTLRLQYTENNGAFLGLGAALPKRWRTVIFSGAVAVVLGLVLAYALVSESAPVTVVVALSLVGGGGIGNLLDRVAHGGYVVDFINLGVGVVRTGIFNVADVAITAGMVLFVWRILAPQRRAFGE